MQLCGPSLAHRDQQNKGEEMPAVHLDDDNDDDVGMDDRGSASDGDVMFEAYRPRVGACSLSVQIEGSEM